MRRLAIIGAGASGLVTLKYALDLLPDWQIHAYERRPHLRGCWGNPWPGFVSTSTKYTTQFACFPRFDEAVDPGQRYAEFFRDGEFGDYLEAFADHFRLRPHIHLESAVRAVRRAANGGWQLELDPDAAAHPPVEPYHQLIVCTGLAGDAATIDSPVPLLRDLRRINEIQDHRIVVLGGGESAADLAHRLAEPHRNNQVLLSLRGGIRVSPRYHPIRRVPSDFLRNRLLLSIPLSTRNRIGQKFVEARIRHQRLFERLFRSRHQPRANMEPAGAALTPAQRRLRKRWDLALTASAKDRLFNTFHTKSEGFLDDVARGRLRLAGPPRDGRFNRFAPFPGPLDAEAQRSDRSPTEAVDDIEFEPTLLLPRIGFRNGLADLFPGESIRLEDFYLATTHRRHSDLFIVGFARPVIGNIPTIAEQQAIFILDQIRRRILRPADLETVIQRERSQLLSQFPQIDTSLVYPVEQFPYCDRLARLADRLPSRHQVGLRRWLNQQLSPATTLHYLPPRPSIDTDTAAESARIAKRRVYLPPVLIALLVLIRLLSPRSGRT